MSNKKEELSQNFLVQKSNPLFSLWQSGFTLSEFKLLDVYLAKIDSRDSDRRTVKFNKRELEEIYGVKQLRAKDVEKSLKQLHGKSIELYNGEKNTAKLVSLFDESEITLNEDGVSQISMTCTNAAIKYFFNVEQIGYFKYRINKITQITSVYSYLMFIFLEYYKFKKEWTISLDLLKQYLNCSNIESYKGFKEFNDKVLKKTLKELSEKDICKFKYETIKEGRTVTELKFTYLSQEDAFLEKQEGLSSAIELNEDDPISTMTKICNGAFNSDELKKIYTSIQINIDSSGNDVKTENERICASFRRVYFKFENQQEKSKKISNPVGYIIKIIENEAKNEQSDRVSSMESSNYSSEEQSYDLSRAEEFAVTFSGNRGKYRK